MFARIAWPVAGLLWGLALAAFFWLPALGETGAVQIGDVTQGYFYYANHFRALDLVQPRLFFSYETSGPAPSPFSMGLVQAAAAGLGLLAFAAAAARARRLTPAGLFLLLGLAVSTFMITPASAWVWGHLPLVRFAQFPWRFLSVQALFAALFTAFLVPGAEGLTPLIPPKRSVGVGGYGSMGVAPHSPTLSPKGDAEKDRAANDSPFPSGKGVGGLGPLPYPHTPILALALCLALAFFALGALRPDFIPVADADVTAERLQLLELFSANIGSTIGFEYLPRGVAARPYTSDLVLGRAPRLKVLAGQASGARLWQRGAREQWQVDAGSAPATVAVPTYWWPGWVAEVDGRRVAARAAPGLGWISFDLEPGSHTVTLRLGRTPLRAVADGVSLAALLAVVVMFLLRGENQFTSLITGHRSLITVLLLLSPFLALRRPAPAAADLPLSMDFVQLAFPHRDTVRFPGAELRAVEYSADHLARGATLAVRSTWQAAQPAEVTLSLEPASNLLDPAPLRLSTAARALAGTGQAETLAFNLSVPVDIPPGVYFVTVRVAGPEGERHALTRAGRERGLVHLAPVWVDDASPAVAGTPLARFGPAVELLSVAAGTAQAGAAPILDVRPVWRAAQDVPASYAVALRLRDAAGNEWAAWDAQAGYGFYPTPLWRPGEAVPDFFRLPLSPGAPPATYTLSLNVYEVPGLDSLGLGEVPVAITATTPIGDRQARYPLTHELALSAADRPAQFTQGEALWVSLGWLALEAPTQDYRARLELAPAAGGSAASEVVDLAPGSPATTWPAGSYVLGQARLPTAPTLAPGGYSLQLTLLGADGTPAAPAVDLGPVQVLGRARSFIVPAVQTPVGATFGGKLEWVGYDAARAEGELRLTLVWRAMAAPGADYKFFVHLLDPVDDFVAAQVDAMPHNFTYPTSQWVEGEVVTDDVTLPLAGVAPGAYRLAVGWYDPNAPSLDRLPAADAQGQPLPADRAIVPLNVTVP